ncbi:hypothetical protein [Actinoplanes sp. NBRC 101535]|uniref:DUF6924 domain-containing protein n=1 Tax=Actinoplanes sp. NBRC 101535 TaxID=3032196 RepID=UPI0024A0A707|nr:hypothetical protein [Actinoplanes sp. NBRC 101535]GLY03982.1 hypothetical protein Acsp01_43610 [Actinoplanes sp. NBRC 101535]
MTELNLPDVDSPLLVRTNFAYPEEWAALVKAAAAPSARDGFTASFEVVDDPAYDGVTPARLLTLVPADPKQSFVLVADELALAHPEFPILVINLDEDDEDEDEDEDDEDDDEDGDGEDEEQGPGSRYGTTFRVVAAELWSVENNLSLANMDWDDFADNVEGDGIFRGFA